jgi:predicted glycogen debranching enzyme
MLVNGFDATLETGSGSIPLTSQKYAPDVLHPDGASRIESFLWDPWPAWRFRLPNGAVVHHDLFVPHGQPRVVLRWRLEGRLPGARLRVRPFLSGRDYHSMHHENAAFDFEPRRAGPDGLEWTPYGMGPGVRSRSTGTYTHAPEWYRQFLYTEERHRGLDDIEDLASPGWLDFDLSAGDAIWVLELASGPPSPTPVIALAEEHRQAELKRRAAFPSARHRAADQYLVRRGDGSTIVAGYPWFTDWGRDTFIALRGLCLATGRHAAAARILLAWSGVVSEGMLPNRFPDGGEVPEYNSVDASLWFIVAVQELLDAGKRHGLSTDDGQKLLAAVDAILDGYAGGTRYGIRADADGLLAAGVPGVQLTWMDAKIGDDVVTPRIGKPVEVQALWLNALAFGARRSLRWRALFELALTSFEAKFWNEARGCLYDVVDVDHVAGRVDASMRPNQIFAVGGLPLQILTGNRGRRVVDAVERSLLTPAGLRSLAPGETGYAPRYEGGVWARDHAYHQGTVWPWLMGGFVDAWIRTHGTSKTANAEAHRRFIQPLDEYLERFGLGHLPEIADAEAPFTPRGCPFQAWSIGELLRATAGNLTRRSTSKKRAVESATALASTEARR